MEDRPILRLDDALIGKIAAGEVVENPASAIKELIENSLDAGATCVTVEIRDGGISYFRVTDNGKGIPVGDVRMAFERHATSKIRKTDDLFDLHTLGFRGEALASIAAVSRVTLTSRHRNADVGVRAVNEGGVMGSVTEAASPQGTTIVARDLFYNTPVRLKFLKKPVTEGNKVAEVIARMILAHPDVAFRLTHNGKQIYSSTGNGELRSAVFCLYGRELANAMLPVKTEGAIAVSGLVGVGLQARSNRTRQTFIVNGRTIRSPLLTQALEEGCRERCTVGHYPVCVLKIDMPVSMVDVNVHPNKLEVRFSNEGLIFQHVRNAVADSFSTSPLDSAPELQLEKDESAVFRPGVVRVIDTDNAAGMAEARRINTEPSVEMPAPVPGFATQLPQDEKKANTPVPVPHVLMPQAAAIQAAKAEEQAPRPTIEQHEQFTSFVTQYFGGAVLRETAVGSLRDEPLAFGTLGGTNPPARLPKAEQNGDAVSAPSQEKTQIQESLLPVETKNEENKALSGYTMLGVAFDTYIILQNEKQMIFIDQHAAHERILYERLMREIDRGAGSQMLMVSQVVHVTPQEREKIEAYAEEIRAAGFDIEPFGEDAYKLLAVPNVLGVPQSRAAFCEMVDRLGELRVLSTQQKRRDAILQMACKKAVKGGDRLTMEEIEPLLADMFATNAPPTCPHGRPLVITLTRAELEKRFRRINT